MHRWVIAVALLAAGCSGSPSPAGPSPTPAPAPSTITINGQVTATNGGQPLPNLSLSLSTATTTTNGNGAFSLTLPAGSTNARLAISGVAIVPRSLMAALGVSRDLQADAIAEGNGFDLAFYRQFVRNGFEEPGTLQPLRRQTQAPRIYLRTIDEAGAPLDAVTLDTVAAALINTAGALTGRYGLAGLELGTATREGMPGWITVRAYDGADAICGQSDVGREGGVVELNYKRGGNCACGGSKIRARTVKHELGHALGFWHTGNPNDLMSGLSVSDCDQQPSARERYHAAIAYSRPVGNADPDSDPASAVAALPLRVVR